MPLVNMCLLSAKLTVMQLLFHLFSILLPVLRLISGKAHVNNDSYPDLGDHLSL